MAVDTSRRSRSRAGDPSRRPDGYSREFLVLAGTVASLLVIGLVMTFSSSFVRSAADTGDAFGIFQRQLLAGAVGLPLLVGAALTDYRVWRRAAPWLLLVALGAGVAVLVPGVGIMANGARRWIDLGPITFQPTELMKLAVPLYLAHVLARRWQRVRGGDLRGLLLPGAPLLLGTALLVMGQPDLETAALIVAIGGLVLFAAGLPGRIIVTATGVSAVLGAAAILSTPFRRQRMLAWIDPMAHPSDLGWQTLQGYISLGSGGVFGRGLGQGRGQWLYVPNAHTDFIFAIIGEELGLLGTLAVLVLFSIVAVVGLRSARLAPDPFGRLVATAITGWVLLQAGMNMGSVVGLLPVTGVTLPLISFGGSSLIMTMLAFGILLAIARHTDAGPRASTAGHERPAGRRRRGAGGRR